MYICSSSARWCYYTMTPVTYISSHSYSVGIISYLLFAIVIYPSLILFAFLSLIKRVIIWGEHDLVSLSVV